MGIVNDTDYKEYGQPEVQEENNANEELDKKE